MTSTHEPHVWGTIFNDVCCMCILYLRLLVHLSKINMNDSMINQTDNEIFYRSILDLVKLDAHRLSRVSVQFTGQYMASLPVFAFLWCIYSIHRGLETEIWGNACGYICRHLVSATPLWGECQPDINIETLTASTLYRCM